MGAGGGGGRKQWPHGRQKLQSGGALWHIAGAPWHAGVGLNKQWAYGMHAVYGMHAEHEAVGTDAHSALALTTCVVHAICSGGAFVPG